jgi:protein-S-isoprenylcysteine O-methyltransferase Ste14
MNVVSRISAAVCAIELLIYWVTVIVKSVGLAHKLGKDPNVIPREKAGRWLRLIWAPTVVAWCVQPWLAVFVRPGASFWIRPLLAAPAAGAFISSAALVLTFFCWHRMGRSWRIGIDPNEKTELITAGPFGMVRHPIYALSIVLMLGTVLAVFTPLMLLTAVVHITMLQLEARREEQYLLRTHGEPYAAYCRKVGRFVPRLGSA